MKNHFETGRREEGKKEGKEKMKRTLGCLGRHGYAYEMIDRQDKQVLMYKERL